MRQGNPVNELIFGMRIHRGYLSALQHYMQTVRDFGRSSLPARRALKTATAYLYVKDHEDGRFYAMHPGRVSEPSPFYCNNPILK